MNLDLKDVGITLVVGAYVLYGVELIWWWAFDINLFQQLRKLGIVSDTGSVAISLALSFAIGMITESSAAYVFRDATSPFRVYDTFLLQQVARPSVDARGIQSEGLLLTPLGRELAANGLFSATAEASVAEAEAAWCAAGVSTQDVPRFRRAVERYYYHSKNLAFTDAERERELLAIQQRMTFVSTFALCSVLLAAVLLGATLAVGFVRLRQGTSGLLSPSWWRQFPLRASLGLLALAGLSWFSYRTESGEFIRRVLGYYSSEVLERRLNDSTTVALYTHASCR